MWLVLISLVSLSSSVLSYDACPPYEEMTDCVNPCLNCEQKGRCVGLPPLCRPGCDCRPGYLRNERGHCVPKSQCNGYLPQKSSSSTRCPRNSAFAWCGPGCNPTCEYPEPEDCSEECVPGCYCLPGFFKTEEGNCVLPQQCDYPINIECKADEKYYEECTPRCKNTCENYNNPDVRCGCDPPGCFCAEGLVLRSDGKCVQPQECYRTQELPPPPVKCPEHAEFITCGPPCPPTCENRNPGPCKLQCIPECHCNAGYLRHKDKCVPIEECDAGVPQGKCPPDEQYYDYIPSCKNTCENFRNPGVVCGQGPPGCFCKEGLVKRRDGKCVSPQQCVEAPRCPENAMFLPCGSACPETCENRNPGPCKDQCIPACFCKPGFLKLNDRCVKAEECGPKHLPSKFKCYPDEQYYDYIPNCKNTCENFNNPGVRCPPGPPGCFCKSGLVQRKDGKCVPPRECSVQPHCPVGEKYYDYVPTCKTTCENYLNSSTTCPPGPPGCFCREGRVRRADGRCVDPRDCPAVPKLEKCPENEVFIPCGPPCPPTCEDKRPPRCKDRCVSACYCKPGYLKNRDGRCVHVENCFPKVTCPPDEQHYAYMPNCKNTCENFKNPRARCQPGPPGCFCREGLVKREDGKCVRPQDCEAAVRCQPDEQFYDYIPNCKNTCENFNNPRTHCNPGPPGCFCRQGLVKRSDGRCVNPSECPAQCGPDEQYYEYVPSCKNTCDNFKNPTAICKPGPPGCFCRVGLVKNKDGKCINPRECAVTCPRPDEQYYDYTPNCKNTCENYNNPKVTCNQGPPGCFCKTGLVKRQDGKCVNPRECPVECLPDEQYYTNIPNCKNTCENFNNPAIRCLPGPSGCFCRTGLVRRRDGKCVRPQECPSLCPPQEQYYNFVPNCKNTCENFNDPRVRCTPGPAGCFCRPGLVRRNDGRCVDPKECPAKCLPDEQYYEYMPNCKNTCENFSNPGVQCALGPAGCFCRPGLVKRKDGRCVDPKECPAKCLPDEQYYDYIPNCKNTCENFNNPGVRCAQGPPGCFCRQGLVRRQDGKCVDPRECPAKCLPDEQFYDNIPNCKNTCENFNNPGVRCAQGPPGCFCRQGLVRRQDGKCVDPKECSPRCLPDEQYYDFIPDCKNTCENFNNPGVRCASGPRGCFCRPGLVKRKDGRCVDPKECPVRCPPDEQYYQYTPSCKNTCENFDNSSVRCPQGLPGCFCKDGLVKRKDGRCVTPQECPANCPPDEQYYAYIPNCKNTCENFYDPSAICRTGPPGCFCRDGLVKRNDGKCVKPTECPVRCALNERYYENMPSCKNTCENYNNPSAPCRPGLPGCFCREGLVKRRDGKCVHPRRCRRRCPPYEQYYTHMPDCKNTCENYNKPEAVCQPGRPGCFCRKGLVKRNDGRCVLPVRCPNNATITNPPPPACQENAVFIPCGSGCPPTCDNRTPRPCLERCVAACFCKPGFLRTNDNRCVLPEQCGPKRPEVPKCPEYSAYLPCGPACPITCDNRLPRQCTKQCVPGCFCLSGYLKNRDNKCVLPEQCGPPQIPNFRPVVTQCPLYSTFNTCASACPTTCSNPSPGPCAKPCEPRCQCDPGYLQDESGKCVPREQCQPRCRLPEEEFLECGPSCPDTCDNRDLSKPPRCNRCVRGCFCRKGWLRTPEGGCIRPEQCQKIVRNINNQGPPDEPQRCPENSRYTSCATGCPITCLNPEPVRNCTVPCAPGCACDPGLYRTTDGRCVQKERCVPRIITKCHPNSTYIECASACPATCKNPNPGPCLKPCIPCCTCNPGFLEDDHGNCVTPSQCHQNYQQPLQGRKIS